MPSQKPRITIKTTVSIIGAGRLGTALGIALASQGFSIEAFVARRLSHAQKAWRACGRQGIPLSAQQLAKLPPSRILLITTPDDAIEPVARNLASAQKGMPNGRTVLHTSGALSSESLKPLKDIGFHTGSLHPLASVSDPILGAASLRGAYFCIEGEPVAVAIANHIVRDLGGHGFFIEPDHKALYHAAAVMASGDMTALLDIAIEMLKRCGLSGVSARRVLIPLVVSAVRNLSTMDPARALTGTFARGDVATVRRHLTAIEKEHLPEALAAYVLLGGRSLSLVKRLKGSPKTSAQISKLLQRADKVTSK
ncbi:MAG: DUF2520 domain-containing protein [Acidobacteriota bacterium]|nr:DUF2520 domain-containing protein [Acidobacteriota bacterium]